MKKSLIAAALAASLLLSGCSGVSQEEYNSLVDTIATVDNTEPTNDASQTRENEAQETHDSKENDIRDYVRPSSMLSLQRSILQVEPIIYARIT